MESKFFFFFVVRDFRLSVIEIPQSDAMSEERKQEQMEKLVREELGLWNLEMLANESRANGESLLGGSGNEASAVFKLN